MLGHDLKTLETNLSLKEKILISKFELAIVIELENILKDKNSINEAVKTRSSIKISNDKGRRLAGNLSDIDDAFTATGELTGKGKCNVNIEVSRVNTITLNHFGVTNETSKELSTREMILFDAVIFQAAHNVFETELARHTEEGIDKLLNAKIELACSHVLQKIKNLRLQNPTGFEVVQELKRELQEREQYYRSKMILKKALHDLALRIYSLNELYQKLHGLNHKKQIDRLLALVEATVERTDISVKNKFNLLFDAVRDSFYEKMSKNTHSCFSFLFQNTLESYIASINKNENDYHFERMLGLIIQATFAEYPRLKDTDTEHVMVDKCSQAILCPQNAAYKAFLTSLYENNQRFQEFNITLKNVGISDREIFFMFTKRIPLNRETITSLWPELKLCSLEDTVIDALIAGINDVEQLEKVINLVDMHSVYHAKAELMTAASNNKNEFFVKTPLHKLENRRAFRDHLKAINFAIAMIKSRQEEIAPHDHNNFLKLMPR